MIIENNHATLIGDAEEGDTWEDNLSMEALIIKHGVNKYLKTSRLKRYLKDDDFAVLKDDSTFDLHDPLHEKIHSRSAVEKK